MPEEVRRPFATGSKPGPDEVDHYLETQGFYRKHIARDASSLFRVVSENIFDIQTFHDKVRQDCAEFMENHQLDYANEVDKNLFNYIGNLRKPRTHGSLLELRVMARKYRRNVILFEPTSNLQTTCSVYMQNEAYDENPPLRVFYSHKDKHFDVIYTMEHVEVLAECQAIVYNLLYSNIYRLPDVPYAVERMLHDQEEAVTLPLPDDSTKYKKQSGEILPFDSHEKTNCVLKDPKTCHFHNRVNFKAIVDENKDSITVINRADDPGRLKIFKPIDGFLHDKEKSCVRQLLDEKITPFPYKVAKALDPSIYRNTEFELWSENRKEQRMKWLESTDFPLKTGVDDKWLLYDRRTTSRKFFDGKLEQAFVDENEYMSLNDDMKKKYVVLDPSAEPFHQLSSFSNFMPSKDSLGLTVMPANLYYNRETNNGGRGSGNFKRRGGGRYNYNYNNRYNDFQNRHGNQYQQPVSSASDLDQSDKSDQTSGYRHHESFESENQNMVPNPIQVQITGHPTWTCAQPGTQFAPAAARYSVPAYQAPYNFQQVMPYGNFSIPPPVTYAVNATAQNVVDQPLNEKDLMNIMREPVNSTSTVNWAQKESSDPNGKDLPLDDIPTLQFYFNLGVRYFTVSGNEQKIENVTQKLENLEVRDNGEKSVSDHLEPPPAPTNTPVTTKTPSNCSSNDKNRQHSANHFRRPLNSQRDGPHVGGSQRIGNWSNQRKEIKFNSNVKNVHKAESKVANNQQQQGNQEKTSPTNTVSTVASLSPILPVSHDGASDSQNSSQQNEQNLVYQPSDGSQQIQPEFYPQQNYWQRPYQMGDDISMQRPGVVYQVISDDGSLSNPYTVPPYQYSQYQTHFIPHGQFQPQQQFVPQAQVMYQQQPIQQVMEGSTLSSNDSGVAEPAIYYQPQQIQYYAHPPQYVYYAAPLPVSPQLSSVGPVFPAQITPQLSTVSQSSGKDSQMDDRSSTPATTHA